MKLQLNGFDIEINVEGENMSIKVLDANGKELSNNSYAQTSSLNDEPTETDMPTPEEVGEQGTENETDVAQSDETTNNEGDQEPTEEDNSDDDKVGESLEMPTFDEFIKTKK